MNKPVLQSRIPEDELKQLQEIADERQISLSELVRRLLAKCLRERLDKEV